MALRDPETFKLIETAQVKLQNLIKAQDHMEQARVDLMAHLRLMAKKDIQIDLHGDQFRQSAFRLTEKIMETVRYWD